MFTVQANNLNLLPIACGDVGYSPADFLAYRLLRAGTQQVQQTRQNAAAENQLRLNVIACHYVADSSQSCCHDTW